MQGREKAILLFAACTAFAASASAADVKSAYTKIDLKKCRQTQKPDGQVFEGSWRCKGIAGYDIFLTAADSREQVGFAKGNKVTCAGGKSFSSFNSAGNTIEWRVKNNKPLAAIQRWTVSIDPEKPEQHASWLVVNKIEGDFSCHMHYVSGSFPNANETARRVADAKSAAFKCENDKPTFDSTIGPPPIELDECSAREQY